MEILKESTYSNHYQRSEWKGMDDRATRQLKTTMKNKQVSESGQINEDNKSGQCGGGAEYMTINKIPKFPLLIETLEDLFVIITLLDNIFFFYIYAHILFPTFSCMISLMMTIF